MMATHAWTPQRTARVIMSTLLLTALCSGCKPTRLDEEMIRDMVDTGLRATANRNATLLCDQIAEDADIRLVLFKFSGSDIRTFSKGQWCDYLRDAFSQSETTGMSVDVHMNIQSLNIASDGKSAELNADVVEQAGFNGQTLVRMNSKQSYTIELRKGKPLYTRLSARYTS